ncbi:hypothetical protein DBY73_016715 [Enterobacter sp. RIT418]|nr:hypothetical protein DBY73_016715 [Enterobacter sp. RIT 418]
MNYITFALLFATVKVMKSDPFTIGKGGETAAEDAIFARELSPRPRLPIARESTPRERERESAADCL